MCLPQKLAVVHIKHCPYVHTGVPSFVRSNDDVVLAINIETVLHTYMHDDYTRTRFASIIINLLSLHCIAFHGMYTTVHNRYISVEVEMSK